MTQLRKGVILALVTAVISGVAVFINKFGVSFWETSTLYTAGKNILAAVFLTTVMLTFVSWQQLKEITKQQWIKLGIIGVIGGSIPFVLFFKSLTLLPVSQAAFIHKTLFVWVAVLAIVFLKEKLTAFQWVGMAILLAGVVMLGGPIGWSWGAGMWLALIATLLWSVENIIAKVVLKDVPALVVGWARMAFGSVLLIAYVVTQAQAVLLVPNSWPQFGWIVITGLVLFGYVATWYTALKHAPATVVSTVLVLAFPITVTLNKIWAGKFSSALIIPLAIIVAGVVLYLESHKTVWKKILKVI